MTIHLQSPLVNKSCGHVPIMSIMFVMSLLVHKQNLRFEQHNHLVYFTTTINVSSSGSFGNEDTLFWANSITNDHKICKLLLSSFHAYPS